MLLSDCTILAMLIHDLLAACFFQVNVSFRGRIQRVLITIGVRRDAPSERCPILLTIRRPAVVLLDLDADRRIHVDHLWVW